MNLTQKVFDITPDWLRVRMFELTGEEKFFLDVLKEKRAEIREYIFSQKTERANITECKCMIGTLKFLLDKYGKNGRFYRYFSEKAMLVRQDFEFLLKYH